MKNLLHYAVAGVIAAALTVLLKLLLSQQGALLAWHYPPYELAGQEGLRRLGRFCLWGAAYAAAWGLLLRSILPSGLLLGSLFLGAVPTLVSALVLPLTQGAPAIRQPWTLAWIFFHWVFYALCLLFIEGSRGGRGGGEA